ncbi:MAG: YggS family pyridoxal phosphate-dependent enzyme [Acidimicrobiia bacterium]
MSALPTAEEVRTRLAAVRARIAAAGGDPARIAVLGVTKGHPPEVVPVALDAGLVDLGENYAQELLAKATATAAGGADRPVRWHFIGHLQRNKVRQLAPHVALWQSIDRPELVDELARRAPGARLLVQVNATGEQNKGGCPLDAVAALVDRAVGAGLAVEGLMTVGPTDADRDPAPGFAAVRALVDRLGLTTCSMGMTDDLETAVREGSTMVRIGTALFGARAPRVAVGD